MAEILYNDVVVYIFSNFVFSVASWELGIDHRESIYTSEIGRNDTSGLGLWFCLLSRLKKMMEKVLIQIKPKSVSCLDLLYYE